MSRVLLRGWGLRKVVLLRNMEWGMGMWEQ
jgi:hypothetical protein